MSEIAALISEAEQLSFEVNGRPENLPVVLPRLLAMLDISSDPAVLVAVISSLGSAWDERASLAVLPFATHDDARVRLEVARAAVGGLDNDDAVRTVATELMALSRDESTEVRDWATFGLGSALDLDSPEIREA